LKTPANAVPLAQLRPVGLAPAACLRLKNLVRWAGCRIFTTRFAVLFSPVCGPAAGGSLKLLKEHVPNTLSVQLTTDILFVKMLTVRVTSHKRSVGCVCVVVLRRSSHHHHHHHHWTIIIIKHT
jgi:hypothetical protein